MTAEGVTALLQERAAARELVWVSWIRDAEWRESDWADVTVVDACTLAVREDNGHRYVPAKGSEAQLVTLTAELAQAVVISGRLSSVDDCSSQFVIEGFTVDDVATFQPSPTHGPDLQKPESFSLVGPESFHELRRWMGCVQVFFREDLVWSADARELHLRFWEMAEEISEGPSGSAALPYHLTIPHVEDIRIRMLAGYDGYFFGPDLVYNARRRRITFGQRGIMSLFRGPDIAVDVTVSHLAGSVRRTGIPTRNWQPDNAGEAG